MKRKWLGLALAAAMACAGAASAAEYTDSSVNYPDGWNDGTNGGEGFGAWQISANSGSGYAGGGIWETGKAEVSGDVVDANGNAFGIVGKGDGSSFTATRNFRAPLAVGDSFEFDMAVNWDCGSDEKSKKGIALLLGSEDVIVINHDHFPGPMSVNGFTDDPALQNYGTGTMHWTIVAKDATTVTVTGTARDGKSDPYSTDITLSSSALTGFRLQSALQQNWEEGDSDEERQAKADKRQSYFNNFKLTIAGELPELGTLEFTAAEWAVASKSQTLSYKLKRSITSGALEVTVSSSDESFVKGTTVPFADGEAEVPFTLDATLTGYGNYAKITASATGCDPATYEVKGPAYGCNAEGGDTPWVMEVSDTRTFTVYNHKTSEELPANDALVTLVSTDEAVVKVGNLGEWSLGEDGKTRASCTVTGLAGGQATVKVLYDGVEMNSYNFTVAESGATLSGPTALHVGNVGTYKLDVTLAPSFGSDTFQLVADDDSLVSIDPKDAQELTESGPIEFKVTALAEGDVMLSIIDDKGLDADIAPITVTITEAPSYDDYVAYDEASLYEGTFDFASTGAGTEGFGAWKVVQSDAQWGDVIVDGGDAGMPAILSDDGKALALYANGGENPVYSVVRPFANTLQPGQKASVEFIASEASGSRVFQFVRIDGDSIYKRFEIWNNSGNIGINVDGVETAINWSKGLRRVEASIELAADGSSYTLELLGHNPGSDLLVDDIYQHVVNSDVGYWGGGIQGIFIEGSGSGENFVFNRLAIEQVEEPTPPPPPAVTMGLSGVWNPDEVGVSYEFTLTPSEVGAIGLVDLSLEGEGAELSETQVDLTEGAAKFTFTLTGETLPAGATFKITASAQDVDVVDATYDITVWEPSTMLVVVGGQYEYDYVAGGTVEFWLYGTPKFVGQQADLDSGNEGILAPPSPAVATVVPYYTESDEAKFAYTMVGAEEGEVWVHATKDEAEWGWAGITINGKAAGGGDVVPVKKISIKDGEMTLTLDGKGSQVFGATEVKDGGWYWQALDLAIIGDGTSVSLPMDAPKMIFKVE